MESENEGRRVEAKTDKHLLLDQLSLIGVKEGSTVLDLGCAAGTTCRIIKEVVGESGQVTGIDSSEIRIDEARSISNNVEYRLGKAESLPAKDQEFDVSWSRFLFEYLVNPTQVLQEMIRVTKSGGIVAVADIDGNCLWHYPITTEFEDDLAETVSFLSKAGFDPFIGRKLYSLFKQVGLKDIEVDIRPYHKIVGKMSPNTEQLWRFKLKNIAENLIRMGWNEQKTVGILEKFLLYLGDESTFTYSVLITVKGTV